METEGEPEVSWFYEGRKLKTTGNEFISITSDKDTHTLCIGETVLEDEGFYECVAVYQGSEVEISCSADVLIETCSTAAETASELDFDMDNVAHGQGSEDSRGHSDDDGSSSEGISIVIS